MLPVVVVSNSEQNAILSTVVVIPLSTKPTAIWPWRLRVSMPDGTEAYAVLPGIRQVHKRRLVDVTGQVPTTVLGQWDAALCAYLTDR